MIYSNESIPLSLKQPSGRKLSFLNPTLRGDAMLLPFSPFPLLSLKLPPGCFPRERDFSHLSKEARSSYCVALQVVIYWTDPRGVSTTNSQVETWLSSKQTKFTSYIITSLCKHILLWYCLCRRWRKAEIVKYRITKNKQTAPLGLVSYWIGSFEANADWLT